MKSSYAFGRVARPPNRDPSDAPDRDREGVSDARDFPHQEFPAPVRTQAGAILCRHRTRAAGRGRPQPDESLQEGLPLQRLQQSPPFPQLSAMPYRLPPPTVVGLVDQGPRWLAPTPGVTPAPPLHAEPRRE